MKKGKKIAGTSVVVAIVMTAIGYIGFKEKPNNSGFQDRTLETYMRDIGWRPGDSWCVDFAKVCWYLSISNDTVRNLAMKLIVGNSQSTLANFENYIKSTGIANPREQWFIISDSAIVGSIVIWQHYKNGIPEWSGHAGIVDSVFKHRYYDFHTIEGNTNDNGSSNGDRVLPKYRRYNYTAVNGLRTKKFICINLKKYKP